MRNKGAIWALTIALILVCLYQLSFTVVTYKVHRDAENYGRNDQGIILNSKVDHYLDSISGEPVYNFIWLKKYTYRECQEREISLGLDLQGGMDIVLEVSVADVVRSLANNSKDSTFVKAMALARQMQASSNGDFVDLFGEAFNKINPSAKLSSIFTSAELRDRINYNSSNDDVLKVIRDETDKAVANSFNIINTRINHFGVSSPNIQRIQGGDRILVELPGVEEKDRVRKLLQGSAKLEFWETFDNTEIASSVFELNKLIKNLKLNDTTALANNQGKSQTTASTGTENTTTKTSQKDSSLLQQLTQKNANNLDTSKLSRQDLMNQQAPLFAVMTPSVDQTGKPFSGSVFGRALYKDSSKVNQYLRLGIQHGLFPRNFKYAWSALPENDPKTNKPTDVYTVHALKITTRDGSAPLTGDVITKAINEYDQTNGNAYVSMSMNAEGSQKWALLTGANVGKIIAVVMDGYVYSYPRVNEKIPTGNSQISGNFTPKEAEDLANLLKSGTMPAPCRIIQEDVIGPSLGSQSVHSGLNALIIAFLAIFAYMIFFYGFKAGSVANLALVLNIFFIIGVLASLGLSLTLPGMAGIILTIGMAVDANVLINERIREEVMAGKGIRMAIADGYKGAMSAIVDSNLTTIITGIILYELATGPVRGFATTLVVGILSSMFSAIFITRLIFEIYLEKNTALSFSTKMNEGFLKHTKIKFIEKRKYLYGFSIVLSIICISSLFIRGLDQSVDFTGGRNYIIQFDKPINNVQVADKLAPLLGSRPYVINYGTEDKVRITTKYKINDEGANVDEEIQGVLYTGLKSYLKPNETYAQFAANNVQGLQRVGPTIADDIRRQSSWALFAAIAFMFIYIFARFRNWRFGMGAVAALIHDSIMVIGGFSLFYGILPFSLEIDQAFVAAILTVIGYSVNDTVVIFDRIREYLHLHPKREKKELINDAINHTLSRTFNTSMTVLVTVIIVFFFAGEAVMGFAFAMFIGVFTGTYSSVFVATPLYYDTLKAEDKIAKV